MADSTATMNFFQHQEAARKRTGLLVFYFSLAVVSIILAIYAVVVIVLASGHPNPKGVQATPDLWNPDLFLIVSSITILVVAIGSFFKMAELSEGGAAVARMLGGRLVDPASADPDERKLLNIVEEMSIASGVSIPAAYVMDGEDGVNAFAAGTTPENAVVAVTAGCMKLLTRDELQGVIAHEFSHILNADMKLNIKLMGILNGILILSILGYWMLRIFAGSGSRSSSKKGGAGGALMLIGLAVMIIGYIGVFFGNLIKAAVSRQREFLADASAVQFTRNPAGIGGALKKIGGLTVGSQVRSSHAHEASHFFFANGVSLWMSGLFQPHQPLKERIRRIDPSFDGDLPALNEARTRSEVVNERSFTGAKPSSVASGFASDAQAIVGSIGTLSPDLVAAAKALAEGLPDDLISACRAPYGARAVIYCLLLNVVPAPRKAQMERLSQHAEPVTVGEMNKLLPLIEQAGPLYRLPLVDLAMPALRRLSESQYNAFEDNVKVLISADGSVELFEYTLHLIIVRRLSPLFSKQKPLAERFRSFDKVTREAVVLLSAMCHAGTSDKKAAEKAFDRGWGVAGQTGRQQQLPSEQTGINVVDGALKTLSQASPPVKEQVLLACAAAAVADNFITVEEAELLRAVAVYLDCPIPPLLPTGT